MSDGLAIFERLDFAAARAAAGHQPSVAVGALIRALAAVDLAVRGAGQLDDAALAERPPIWVLVYGNSLGKSHALYAVPATAVDADAAAALALAHGRPHAHDGAYDDPARYRAFAAIALRIGQRNAADIARATARAPDARPSDADLAAWAGAWSAYAVPLVTRKAAAKPGSARGVSPIDAPIVGLAYVFEHL